MKIFIAACKPINSYLNIRRIIRYITRHAKKHFRFMLIEMIYAKEAGIRREDVFGVADIIIIRRKYHASNIYAKNDSEANLMPISDKIEIFADVIC